MASEKAMGKTVAISAGLGAPPGARPAVRPQVTYLALLAGMLCISFTAIFTKWAQVPGPAAAAWRMSLAAIVLAIPFAWRWRTGSLRRTLPGESRPSGRNHAHAEGRIGAGSSISWPAIRIAALGGLWFGLNLALLNSALLLTSAATATLLDNTAPIWVGVGAMLLFHERLRARYWLGLGLALAGAAVVSLAGLIGPALPQGMGGAAPVALNPGDALAFVGATFYAAYLLTTQRARRDLDTVSYLWLIEASAAITLLVLVAVLRLPLVGYPLRSYLSLIAVAVLSQTGGWLLISYALGYLPASTAVVVLLGQPIVTSLLSVPLLGESLALHQVAGGALVLVGIYLCVRRAGE